MTEYLLLAHWLLTFFLLLMWCVEQFARRWTGYRFVYRLYGGLPLLLGVTVLLQANAPSIATPEIMAALPMVHVPSAVETQHVNILQWLWVAGVAFFLGGLLRQWRLLGRLSGEHIALGSMEAMVVNQVSSPCLKGILRPVVLLPANYHLKFQAHQLELIVAHEQVHARRMDNLWNLVALGLRALFWFNPVMWFGYQRFRTIQELSCDETVLAAQPPIKSIDYAKTLLVASISHQSQTPVCTHYGDRKMMLKRMEHIKTAGIFSRAAQWILLSLTVLASGSLSVVAATNASPDETRPVRIATVQPKYPQAAFEAKAEADVILEFNIGATDGRPFDIRVVENTAPEAYREGFNNATIKMLEQWRYEPTGRVQRNVRTKTRYRLGE